jgi:crossover junction endodeoxyribonuclease RuvC
MLNKTKRIIAVDPGYERLGVAVLEKGGGIKKELVVYSGCFKTPAKLEFPDRLLMVGLELEKIIEKYKPMALAIEKLFFSSNQKTALSVSEARGVAIFTAKRAGLPVFEFSPAEIKLAVTSHGQADKRQVMDMVKKLAQMEKNTASDDELDAIAIGLTAFAVRKDLSTS